MAAVPGSSGSGESKRVASPQFIEYISPGVKLGEIRSILRLLHQTAQLEDRENNAHSDKADDAAHEDDHQRLDHAGDGLDDALELFGIELADLVEHFAELTGLFAGADHLHDGARQQGAPLELVRDLLALLHRAVN